MQGISGLEYEIKATPTFSIVEIALKHGEQVVAESGAMIWMDQTISLKTSSKGGVMSGLKRKLLTKESFFQNTFTAEKGLGKIGFAPSYVGDMQRVDVKPEMPWIVSGGAYVCASVGVKTDSKWQGFKKALLSREGGFFLHASAEVPSDMWVSAYGGFRVFDLQAGESIVVDTGHLVSMELSASYNVRRIGGIKSLVASGEGMVMDVTGPGKVITQTRAPSGLIGWISSMLPSS